MAKKKKVQDSLHLPTEMWTVEIDRYGGPEEMVIRTVPVPHIPGDKIFVEVYASAVNPKDVAIRKGYFAKHTGHKFPLQLGQDFAGIVVATGRDAGGKFERGDKCCGTLPEWTGGAYAQYVIADPKLAARADNLDLDEASALPTAGLTALQALRDLAHVKEGQTVCINGASGGVGTFAIQLAKLYGAQVTAICSDRNMEFCKSVGADETLNYKLIDIKELDRKFDLFFDVFGNLSFHQVSSLLNEHGEYITTQSNMEIALESALTLFGKKARNIVAKPNEEDLAELVELATKGQVRSIVGNRFRFTESAQAHAQVEVDRRGKTILSNQIADWN